MYKNKYWAGASKFLELVKTWEQRFWSVGNGGGEKESRLDDKTSRPNKTLNLARFSRDTRDLFLSRWYSS